MANRRFEQFNYSLVKKLTHIVGNAQLDDDGTILSQDIPGATLTKTGAGAYLLTLADKYSACMSVMAQLGDTTEDLQAVPGAVDVSSAKTIVIRTATAGASADATATASLYVSVFLRNSSIS